MKHIRFIPPLRTVLKIHRKYTVNTFFYIGNPERIYCVSLVRYNPFMRKYGFYFLRTRHSDARMSIEAYVCAHTKLKMKCVLLEVYAIFSSPLYAWRHIILISQSRLNVGPPFIYAYSANIVTP